jgi:hypothetical protein
MMLPEGIREFAACDVIYFINGQFNTVCADRRLADFKQVTRSCVTNITATFRAIHQVTVVSEHRSRSNAEEKSHDQSQC